MNNQGRGTHGHIALHVDDMNAAEAFFTSRGYELDESSRMLNPDGSTFLIYLKKEIAGFAIHLTRS
jgi:2-dehydro-3-deoxyphosphogluconate aldolase/(4S)-4-hydroxy-2-oxoglutarate aldolase